jgi:hypothetical protein
MSTNTYDPLEDGDTVTAEFYECSGGPVTVTGKVVRLFPESRTLYVRADNGYYPMRACIVLLHSKPWEVG